MRPAGTVGDVRKALMWAACAAGQPATLRELAANAGVGFQAARRTVDNMCRAGDLSPCGEKRVEYRNRPVAVYAPASSSNAVPRESGWNALAGCMSGWR